MKKQLNDQAVYLQEAPAESMLGDFFHEELKDLYRAELYVAKILPEMKMAASSGELVAAFEAHYDQTQSHLNRLEQIFDMLGYPPEAKKCEAMEGLAKEAERVINETEYGTATRDTGLIMAAQKIEHYEIATYGCLQQVAISSGYDEIAGILFELLTEKKETDKILTFIAENCISYEPTIEE
jgi:ferritin-like metal-binding protein YciE